MIKYIMYNVQDYSVLINNDAHPIICDSWYFIAFLIIMMLARKKGGVHP